MTREQWAEIQAIFRINAWSLDHTNIGDGAALVQGLPRCVQHRNRLMSTYYKRGKSAGSRRSYCYRCSGDYDLGGRPCQTIPGGRLDDAIAPLVLGRMSPPSIAEIQAEFDRAPADSRAEQRHREIEKARLRQRVLDLEQKLDLVDPDSVPVFKMLARNLTEATRNLAALEEIDEAQQQRSVREEAAVLAEAEEIAPNIQRIWDAPTTTDRDRKALVRTLVQTILIEEWSDDRLCVRVKWTDGVPDTVLDVWLNDGIERQIMEMHGHGKAPGEIVEHLNVLGTRTRRGKTWTDKAVRTFIWRRRHGGGTRPTV